MNKRFLPFLIILLISIVGLNSFAQVSKTIDERKKQLIRDHTLFNSAQGREFYIAIPPNEVQDYTANVLEVYITTSKKTQVTMESPGLGVKLTKDVEPMKITTFSSANGETTFQWEMRESERVMDKGLRFVAGQPISLYCLNAKVYTSDGFLGIPVSAWGTEYIHCSYYDFNEPATGGIWAGGFIVCGAYDNTKIRIDLKGRGKGYAKTKGGREIGETIRETINRGQVYMVKGDATTRGQFDISGTKIVGSKPIGLISFHERCIIPYFDIWNGRDCLSEMLPPIQAWGKKYQTIELKRDKGKGDFFRVVAAEPNTKFKCKWYDMNTDQLLGNWEQTLANAGDWAEYLMVTITGPDHDMTSVRGTSLFEADKPVLVLQYSYSADWDGNAVFDPFQVLVVPREQFIPATVFQTPANKSFVTNWFNIIAVGDTNDLENKILESVTLDGKPIHVLEGRFLYNRIPTTDLYWARIAVEPGAHVVKSNTKFGGYIYGFSNWDSYAWPAAMAINKVDETDTLEPELYFTEECGNYTIRATELRNGGQNDNPRQVDQGVSEIQLLDGSYNYELEFITDLVPYPPVYDYTFKLKVLDKFKPGFALLSVVDRAGNVAIDSVRYEPDSLDLNPRELLFGKVRVRTSKDITAKLMNISDSTIKIKMVYLKKNDVFQIVSGAVPPEIDLLPGTTHDIVVRYTPKEELTDDLDFDIDSIMVETNCLKFKWPVTGQGVLPRIVVEDWDAGPVSVGKTLCKTEQTSRGLKIENTGTMDLTITSAENVAPPFTLSNPTIPPMPIVIKPKETIYLREVCFDSKDTLEHSIDVTFKSDADPVGSDSVSNWRGRGLIPGPYITSKNWERRRVLTINDSVVVLRNAGNTPVYVTDINLETNDPNFKINRNAMVPKLPFNLGPENDPNSTIKEIVIPVTYTPQAEGPHHVKIIPVFDDPTIPAGSVFGNLDGFGFLPKIEVTGWTFDPPILINTVHPTTGYVTIKSTSTTADLYVEKVNWSPASINPQDFAWDMTQNPKLADFTIKMGEEVKLPVIFTAKGLLERRATVDVVSDAAPGPNVNPRITTSADVIGNVYETGIVVDSIDFGTRLLCDQPILKFHIRNTSTTTAANVDRFEWISGDASAFTIIDQPPFNIAPSGTIEVQVRFAPGMVGKFQGILRVYSDVGNDHYVFIKGETYTVSVALSLPTLTEMAPGMSTEAPPFKDFPVRAESNFWGFADIKSFVIELKYKSEWMTWKGSAGDAIRRGELLDGTWNVTGTETRDAVSGLSTLTIKGNGTSPITKSGLLVYPVFSLLLADTSRFTPDFGKISFDLRDTCVTHTSKPGEIQLATCVQDLRNVKFSDKRYFLQSIEPNPVGGEGFTLKYGVALEGETTIELVNTNGEVVTKLVSGTQAPGRFEKQIETSNLNSGVYFIRMKSGPYSEMQRLVISK